MRRLAVLATLLGLGVLAACGSSTPSEPPSHNVTPLASTTSAPVTSSPTPTTTPTTGHLTLLPPSCTKADGLRLVDATHDGAGGTNFAYWSVTARRRCTLDGVPHVTVYDAQGNVVDIGYSSRWYPKRPEPEPFVVGPHPRPDAGAVVTLAKYRCDTTPHPGSITSAAIALPVGGRIPIYVTTVRAKLDAPFPYCPKDEGDQRIHVAPVGLDHSAKKPYAVNLHSDFDPGSASTWASTDLDGDGLADTVLLRTNRGAHAMLEIEFGDGKGSENELGFQPARLQGFSDLNGDGFPEILVASTTDGADAGYTFGSAESSVIQLLPKKKRVPMAVVMKPRGQWMPYFATNGRGDLWGALQCHGDDVTQVKAILYGGDPYDEKGTNTYKVTRTTWHLRDGKATKLGTSTEVERIASRPYGRTWLPVVSSCPGIGVDGWAG